MERNSRIIFINSSVPVKYHSYRLLYNVHGSCMYIDVCTMNLYISTTSYENVSFEIYAFLKSFLKF